MSKGKAVQQLASTVVKLMGRPKQKVRNAEETEKEWLLSCPQYRIHVPVEGHRI